MSCPCNPIHLSAEEEAELGRLGRDQGAPSRHVDRARIVLLVARGKSTIDIAAKIGTRPATVSKWRVRFEKQGLMGLRNDFRRGRPRIHEDAERLRQQILKRIKTKPPGGHAIWNGPTLGKPWASACSGDARGAFRPIPSFNPRAGTSLGSTLERQPTPSSFPWMESLATKICKARWDGSRCTTVAQCLHSPKNTNGVDRPLFSRR